MNPSAPRFTRTFALAALAAASCAIARPVYQADFEGESASAGPDWTFQIGSGPVTAPLTASTAYLTRFLGSYSQGTATLTLAGLNAGQQYDLAFDFYAIDSWDGDHPQWGPDRFSVRINNSVAFSHTFSNTPGFPRSYPGAAASVGHFGFNGAHQDGMYTDITLRFIAVAGANIFSFYATGLQTLPGDESWGLDNVRVSSVPAPGALAMFGIAALAGARRRRSISRPDRRTTARY